MRAYRAMRLTSQSFSHLSRRFRFGPRNASECNRISTAAQWLQFVCGAPSAKSGNIHLHGRSAWPTQVRYEPFQRTASSDLSATIYLYVDRSHLDGVTVELGAEPSAVTIRSPCCRNCTVVLHQVKSVKFYPSRLSDGNRISGWADKSKKMCRRA